MHVTEYQGRYKINAIDDEFTRDGKVFSDIAGYGKCLGWILSLLGLAVCLKDEQNNTFYLNRKSAIKWINRHVESKMGDESAAKDVKERIISLALVYPSAQTHPVVQLEEFDKKKKYQANGSIWFEKVSDATEYRELIKSLIQKGFFQVDNVTTLPVELQTRLFDHLSSDTFRYGYESSKFASPAAKEAFLASLTELFFTLTPSDRQLARFSTYLPKIFFQDVPLERLQRLKQSLQRVEFKELRPLFKTGSVRSAEEFPTSAQEHILNILSESFLTYIQKKPSYKLVAELVQKFQEIEPTFNWGYLVKKVESVGVYSLGPYYLLSEVLKFDTSTQGKSIGNFDLEEEFANLDRQYDQIILEALSDVNEEKQLKFSYSLLQNSKMAIFPKFLEALRQKGINTLLWR